MSRITTDSEDLERVRQLLEAALKRKYPQSAPERVPLDPATDKRFADFATGVAFPLAKKERKPPNVIAEEIVAEINVELSAMPAFRPATSVKGFINITATPLFWQNVVAEILRVGPDYGRGAASGKRVSLEFGSANPTGPLLVVQGRSLAIGSTLASAMRFAGDDVVTDWIVNDTGSQMQTLARSLYARWRKIADPGFPFPEDGYPGEYLVAIAQRFDAELTRDEREELARAPIEHVLARFERYGRDAILEGQKETCRRFGTWFYFQSERIFHEAGLVDAVIELLVEEGYTVREGDAIALRPDLDPEDEKARILRRSDGRPTYFGADIIYHFAKYRHATEAIDVLGPDHHGYLPRVRAMAELWRRLRTTPGLQRLLDRLDALGLEGATEWAGSDVSVDVLIAQQVSLVRGGEKMSMSKRAGLILTLDEILDEVGVDAARFFFIMLAPESPLTFDVELAVKQSNDNPVYYVQYGHARIASLIAHARSNPATAEYVEAAQHGEHLDRLSHATEVALARRLSEWPR
ncbi:MAG: arginine--tRNA ligase, partial [Candidatus Eremiobacteraeota bacterium]|nr:arginine--tRNA ligase [Candidatus Eremiobacteraeota bacterium]